MSAACDAFRLPPPTPGPGSSSAGCELGPAPGAIAGMGSDRGPPPPGAGPVYVAKDQLSGGGLTCAGRAAAAGYSLGADGARYLLRAEEDTFDSHQAACEADGGSMAVFKTEAAWIEVKNLAGRLLLLLLLVVVSVVLVVVVVVSVVVVVIIIIVVLRRSSP